MDIDTPEEKLKNITLHDSSFNDLLEHMQQAGSNHELHLSLFLGVYSPDKKEALQKIAEETDQEIEYLDFNDLVIKSEEETYRNIDEAFDSLQGEGSILYFKNGDKLCGAYTGFTHSRVKYAGPHERYFLKKVQEFDGIVIVDVTEYTAADKTLRRAAHSIVKFPLPDSSLKRFMWHLKNYTLHGFELRSKRPEAYGDTAGNF